MPYLAPPGVELVLARERRFELGTLIPLGAGVLKKDLLALALLVGFTAPRFTAPMSAISRTSMKYRLNVHHSTYYRIWR